MNNRDRIHVQLIQYNASLKGNQARNDCSTETSYLHYLNYKRSLLSVVINTITSLLYSEQLGLERHTIKCNYSA